MGFNPRLPGGRRQPADPVSEQIIEVSIHAFRGEGDFDADIHQIKHQFQSTPSGGKATSGFPNSCSLMISFQSTPSGGKATAQRPMTRSAIGVFQSTPSGGKATHRYCTNQAPSSVSIHAFRGEGDETMQLSDVIRLMFQSTPSGGKATARCCCLAPRCSRFNPRLPGGRRPSSSVSASSRQQEFQSTPSGGKATCRRTAKTGLFAVSIHAFRGEGDLL